MALFDFLKRKRKQEKEAQKKPHDERVEKSEHTDYAETEKPAKNFELGLFVEHFVLETPHVTERARMLSEVGQYTFRVHTKASKQQIRESVEKLYHVHVENVRIVKIHEKPRRRGLTEGVKRGYKKAVVALRKGEAIDIF